MTGQTPPTAGTETHEPEAALAGAVYPGQNGRERNRAAWWVREGILAPAGGQILAPVRAESGGEMGYG